MCRLLFGVAFTVVLIFLAANTWLGSDRGLVYLAKKAKARTGLHFEVGAAFWSPWSDLRMGTIDVFKSEGGLKLTRLEQLDVSIHYSALLEKKVKLRSIEIQAPLVEFDEAQLRAVVGGGALAPVVEPALASRQPVKPPVGGVVADAGSVKPAVVTPEPAKVVATKKGESRSHEDKVKPHVDYPFERLTVSGGKFLFRKSDGSELLAAEGIELRFPVGGRPGRISVNSLKLKDSVVAENAEFRLIRVAQGLQLQTESVRCLGAELRGVALLDNKFRFETSVALEVQEVSKKYKWGSLSYQRILAGGGAVGQLFSPKSWQFQGEVNVKSPKIEHPSKSANFDQLRMKLYLGSRGLVVSHVEGVGPEMQLLGRGFVALNGDVDASCRVLATEDEAVNIFRFAGGLQVHFPMLPLQSQDLFYNDVALRGKLWNPEFKSSKHWRNLKGVFQSAEGFLQRESAETLRGR